MSVSTVASGLLLFVKTSKFVFENFFDPYFGLSNPHSFNLNKAGESHFSMTQRQLDTLLLKYSKFPRPEINIRKIVAGR
jgi:heme/copper-type cytochrome/quinol oxidase subunit 3